MGLSDLGSWIPDLYMILAFAAQNCTQSIYRSITNDEKVIFN